MSDRSIATKSRPRRRRRGDALTGELFAACIAELGEVGYERLAIESVAARAGAGKASIYRRWDDKRAFVRAAILDAASGDPSGRGPLARTELRDVLVTLATLLNGPNGAMYRSVITAALIDPPIHVAFAGGNRSSKEIL